MLRYDLHAKKILYLRKRGIRQHEVKIISYSVYSLFSYMAPVSILGATKESNKSEEGDTNQNIYTAMCLIYPLSLKES